MSAPLSEVSLPYGANDLKLTQYGDALGMVLGTVSVDLPYLQHLNFTEAEEFAELRGDDKLITTRGRGAQVNWDIEGGGISSKAWAVITGGSVIERGLEPYREIEIRKKATQKRPFFRIDGKIISDSGGDILMRIYRCRANGDITANFTDGEFTTSSIAGVGLPLLDDMNDLLYSIFIRETSTALTLTPDPNPVQSPLNLTAGAKTATSVALTWTPVVGATKYGVYYSDDDGDTWTKFATEPTVANVSLTGLTTATPYWIQVTAFVGGIEGDPCPHIVVTTS
jgi:hypothetical protein